MSTKRSSTVMVLSVHIVGDGAHDGHEAGARRDWQKPALGKEDIDQFSETHAAFAANDSRRFVKPQNAIETAALDELAAAVEAGVSVTAAVAKGV